MSFTYFSQLPKYSILDPIIGNKKKAVFFMDFKNGMYFIHGEESRIALCNSQENVGDKPLLEFIRPILTVVSHFKRYCSTRGISCEIVFFADIGESMYHKNIYSRYKERRKIRNISGITDAVSMDDWMAVCNRNIRAIQKIFSRIHGVKFYILNKMESDFVPYYLLTRKYMDPSKDVLYMICSSDHDMNQVLCNTDRHICIFKNVMGVRKLIGRRTPKLIFGLNEATSEFIDYFPLFMAITGDIGDDIPRPIKGMGPTKAFKLLKSIITQINMEEIRECAGKTKMEKLFEIPSELRKYKLFRDLSLETNMLNITRNFLLVDFEMMSRFVDFNIFQKDNKKILTDDSEPEDFFDSDGLFEFFCGLYDNEYLDSADMFDRTLYENATQKI